MKKFIWWTLLLPHDDIEAFFKKFSQMRCLLHQKEKVKNDGVSTIGDAYHIKIRQIQNIDSHKYLKRTFIYIFSSYLYVCIQLT